jgi:hypothetical protein
MSSFEVTTIVKETYCVSSLFRTSMHTCTYFMSWSNLSSVVLLRFIPHILVSNTTAAVKAGPYTLRVSSLNMREASKR